MAGGLKAELSKKQAELERLYDEGWEKGYPAEFIKRTEERLKTAIAGLTQQVQAQTCTAGSRTAKKHRYFKVGM